MLLIPQGTRQGFPLSLICHLPLLRLLLSQAMPHAQRLAQTCFHFLFDTILLPITSEQPLGMLPSLPSYTGLSHKIPRDPNTGICDIPPRSHAQEWGIINTAGPVLVLLGTEEKTGLWGSHELLSALQLSQNGTVSAGIRLLLQG